jgi:hypothetical protein
VYLKASSRFVTIVICFVRNPGCSMEIDNVLISVQIAFGSPCVVGIVLLIPNPTKRRRLPDVECSRKRRNRKHGADRRGAGPRPRDEVVRRSVEETLNGLLEAEADQLCGAQRYERSPDRVDTRAGSYERRLETKAGPVTLKVPRLRSLPFETKIIERYRRRESSVEEALMEMYLAGVSVRRVEDITEALWGTRVSPLSAVVIDDAAGAVIFAGNVKRIDGVESDRAEALD